MTEFKNIISQECLSQTYISQERRTFVKPLTVIGGYIERWMAKAAVYDGSNFIGSVPGVKGLYDLIQSTQTYKPLYVANAINGKPVMRFDGVDNYLKVAFGESYLQPNTIFIVYRLLDNTPALQGIYDSDDSVSRNFMYWSKAAAEIRMGTPGGSSFNYIRPYSTSVFYNTCEFNGTSSKNYENNVLLSSGDGGPQGVSGFTFGSFNTQALPLNGDIADIIFYNRELTTAEKLINFTALKQDYGNI